MGGVRGWGGGTTNLVPYIRDIQNLVRCQFYMLQGLMREMDKLIRDRKNIKYDITLNIAFNILFDKPIGKTFSQNIRTASIFSHS